MAGTGRGSGCAIWPIMHVSSSHKLESTRGEELLILRFDLVQRGLSVSGLICFILLDSQVPCMVTCIRVVCLGFRLYCSALILHLQNDLHGRASISVPL